MLGMAGFFDKMAEQFSSGSGMDVMAQQRELFQHMRELGGREPQPAATIRIFSVALQGPVP
jgi:hypothetical protein